MNSKAFYLKINRKEKYALKNLSRWIDASYLSGADCIIICDDDGIEQNIRKDLLIYSDIKFIKSEKSKETQNIVENIADINWVNAAYAHLTSFYHASGRYETFWNIDADDTRFCVSIDRMVEILNEVEKKSEKDCYDCVSLDMWRSITSSRHWSFGITFVNGRIDWIEICNQYSKRPWCDKVNSYGEKNIDWFFTYLKAITDKRIETFYVENLRFIHYTNDFFEKILEAGLYHWKDGSLILPLVQYGYGMEDEGIFKIAEDAIRIDVGIRNDETEAIFSFYARDGKTISEHYIFEKVVNQEIYKKKYIELIKRLGFCEEDNVEVIGFGAGNAFKKNIPKVSKICKITRVIDNNSTKWGQPIYDDTICISPKEIDKKSNSIIVIFMYSMTATKQIEQQMKNMGLKCIHMEELLRCVE